MSCCITGPPSKRPPEPHFGGQLLQRSGKLSWVAWPRTLTPPAARSREALSRWSGRQSALPRPEQRRELGEEGAPPGEEPLLRLGAREPGCPRYPPQALHAPPPRPPPHPCAP